MKGVHAFHVHPIRFIETIGLIPKHESIALEKSITEEAQARNEKKAIHMVNA